MTEHLVNRDIPMVPHEEYLFVAQFRLPLGDQASIVCAVPQTPREGLSMLNVQFEPFQNWIISGKPELACRTDPEKRESSHPNCPRL